MVDLPYDWDDYRSDFVPSQAYEAQEAALKSILVSLPPPNSVLEVGPGFGRVTKILTQLWPSEGLNPSTKFYLSDLSEAAIAQTSEACPTATFAYEVTPNGLQSKRPFSRQTFDLVVAIEVLMHIDPTNLDAAVSNLLKAVDQSNPSAALVTCDWTQALPKATPIRNQNFCHDYSIFSRLQATILTATPVGLQTIFVVKPAKAVTHARPRRYLVPHG